MKAEIQAYNNQWSAEEKEICDALAHAIVNELHEAEYKIWHAHPVWFIDGNPVAGYSKQKAGIRLMFWSGADFGDELLLPGTGKFKDASVFYSQNTEIDFSRLKDWLQKAREIQWDYKNIVKRKGQLLRLK